MGQTGALQVGGIFRSGTLDRSQSLMRPSMTSSSCIILLVTFALLGNVSADRAKTCKTCKELGEAININLEKTKNRGGSVTVGGGRTVAYERSQVRLGDILRGACDEATNKDECNELLSSKEEAISKWFFDNPRQDFNSVVCKQSCDKKGKVEESSKKTCNCPFSKWCPCKSMCGGEAKCCLQSLKQCAWKWLNRGKTVGTQYSRYAVQKASRYGQLANKQLDKLPVKSLTDKLPLNVQQKKFVTKNWKAIVLTLLLLVVTPLYYLCLCGCSSRSARVQRSGSRVSTRRHQARS